MLASGPSSARCEREIFELQAFETSFVHFFKSFFPAVVRFLLRFEGWTLLFADDIVLQKPFRKENTKK